MTKLCLTNAPQKDRAVTKSPLVDCFNRCFEVIPATSPSLIDQVHKTRYQVYCRENSYETAEKHPEERESDVYDARSVHYLLIDKVSGCPLGTVRIILSSPKNPSKSFPIQGICQHQLLSQQKLIQSHNSVEVSRFAISKEWKREWISRNQPVFEEDTSSIAQLMPLGLIRGAVKMSMDQGASEWFAVMEPSLLRRLQRFGMYFRPIGPIVEYHGFRQPCHAYLYDLLERVRMEKPQIWDVITDQGRMSEPEHLATRLIS